MALGVGLCLAGTAGAAIVSPDYVLTEIPTSAAPTGGLDVTESAIFLGLGPFGQGTQSIVRIDDAGETVLATGFNSIAGLRYEPIQDRLIIGDNGLEVNGATTGDTLYAIPNPHGLFTAPLLADTIELLPSGMIASVADIVIDPADPLGEILLVSNANGPPGEILLIDLTGPSISAIHEVTGFSAGLDVDSAGEVFFGSTVGGASGGLISSGPVSGNLPASPIATDLVGAFGLRLSADGTLLVTASNFFGDSELLRLNRFTGAIEETIATDFNFATEVAEFGDTVYVIEGGIGAPNRILVLPEPGLGLGLGIAILSIAACRRPNDRSRGVRRPAKVKSTR